MIEFQRPKVIRLNTSLWKEMCADVECQTPEEACGLVVGVSTQDTYQALAVIPTTNVLHSPHRFRVDPQEQLDAFNTIETLGWELIGIYHSHPRGPDEPSPTDIAEAYYPEAVHLIWSGRTDEWKCRGFIIQGDSVYEVPVLLTE